MLPKTMVLRPPKIQLEYCQVGCSLIFLGIMLEKSVKKTDGMIPVESWHRDEYATLERGPSFAKACA